MLSLAHKISASFVARARRKRVFTTQQNKTLERTFFIKCWVGFKRENSGAALGRNFNRLFYSFPQTWRVYGNGEDSGQTLD